MSLNTRVGLLLLALLVSSPVWLPLLPFVLFWLSRERRLGRAEGFRTLPRFLARSIEGYAEATLGTPPAGGFATVARNVDGYLVRVRSPRHWRTTMMLALLEFSPWTRLQPRLSRLPLAARRRWIAERLSTTRGLFAVPSLVRQLVRMGYYADPSVGRSCGFRPMRERVRGLPSRARTATYAALARRKVAG
ncbi:MAG: hypothetical protein JNK78_03705 [Planctomycetes bacterium]|nr:hypothetical protein [Planctomycetota bacterium]